MATREPVIFVIPRLGFFESTVAVVTGFVTKQELKNPDEFYRALKRALTSWVKSSTLGRSMWKESSCNFNINDLSTIGTDIREGKVEDELVIALAEVGISSMTIRCYVSDDMSLNWTYDSNLINKEELGQ